MASPLIRSNLGLVAVFVCRYFRLQPYKRVRICRLRESSSLICSLIYWAAHFKVAVIWVHCHLGFCMQKQKILVVGNGGREYAIGLHLRKDNRIGAIFFAPGNAGTSLLGENLALSQNQDIVLFCQKEHIDWVIIGGETPLVEGLSDALRTANIKVFGPSQAAAQLEGSKAFMKDFVATHNIPTARYLQTNNIQEAKRFAHSLPLPIVIKASGLCAGKGVIIAQTYEEAESTIDSMLSDKSFGAAGERIVIEEFLRGYELSVFGICDGSHFVLLPACQDHKQLYDNDKGPNTGGMGAYAPTPLCDAILQDKIAKRIFAPTLAGMKERGTPFCGVLFAGIMVVQGEPYLLEFNVRFGDPECEVLLPLLKTPLLDICVATHNEQIANLTLEIDKRYCVGVVLASHNYPFGSSTPHPMTIRPFDTHLGEICYAGVSQSTAKADSATGESSTKSMLASGGRVAVAVGYATTLHQAKANAYTILESIDFVGKIYRKDIADKALQ